MAAASERQRRKPESRSNARSNRAGVSFGRRLGARCPPGSRSACAGSAKLDAHHETFSPGDPAAPAMVRARKFELKHRCNERWVLDLDFRAAFGNVQHRTSPGRESAIDGYPRFLIGPSAGRSGFSSEYWHGISTGCLNERSNRAASIARFVRRRLIPAHIRTVALNHVRASR